MKKKENSSFSTTRFISLKGEANSSSKKPSGESKPELIKVKPKTAFSAYKVLYDKLKTSQPTSRLNSSKNTTRTGLHIHSLKALYVERNTFRQSMVEESKHKGNR
jgi:hypothetical protein